MRIFAADFIESCFLLDVRTIQILVAAPVLDINHHQTWIIQIILISTVKDLDKLSDTVVVSTSFGIRFQVDHGTLC